MPQHSESRLVPYSADLMFAVVADVERYPEFLPWVTELRVLDRAKMDSRDVIKARMTVGFSRFRESYTSQIVLDPAGRAIDVAQTEGPFRVLENHWRFTPEGGGCRIDFSIAFEFRNPVLNLVAGAAFGRVMLKTEEAFIKRARKLSKKSS